MLTLTFFLTTLSFSSNFAAAAPAPGFTPTFTIENVDKEYLKFSDDNRTLDILEYRAATPPTIHFNKNFRGTQCQIGKLPCGPDRRIKLSLKSENGLVSEKVFAVSFSAEGKSELYHINLMSKGFPSYHFEGHSHLNKPLIVNIVEARAVEGEIQCRLFIIGPSGELEFARELSYYCADFRSHRVGHTTFYSYSRLTKEIGHFNFFGSRTILDAQLNPIQIIDGTFEAHDFLLLGQDHYVTVEAAPRRGEGGLIFLDKRIKEYNHGDVVFDWGVSDFLVQFHKPNVAQIIRVDTDSDSMVEMAHLNSVQLIGNRGFLVSLGFGGIAYIGRASKKVEWLIGGLNDQFKLRPEQTLHFVHMPTFDPETNRLLVFANRAGYKFGEGFPAQILEMDLDLKKKTVKKFSVIRDGPQIAHVMGSVQKGPNGIYSIAYGKMINEGKIFVESQHGHENFSLKFEDPEIPVYRIYREPYGETAASLN